MSLGLASGVGTGAGTHFLVNFSQPFLLCPTLSLNRLMGAVATGVKRIACILQPTSDRFLLANNSKK